jgi:hypothetical protein
VSTTTATQHKAVDLRSEYEPPALVEIGSVYDLTLNGCFLDKKWGGSDGLQFMGINIPVSSC